MITISIKLKSKLFSELLLDCLFKDENFVIINKLDESKKIADIVITDGCYLKDKSFDKYCNSKILLIDTGLPREEIISLLIKYKLRGILALDTDIAQLKKALKVIHNGQIWISNELVQDLINVEKFNNIGKIKLTDKEKKIIELVCQGLSNKEIAAKLFISEQTVKAHLHRIFQKLDTKNRSQLAVIYAKFFSK